LSAAIGQQELEDGTDFDMGSILDAMVDDFQCRWGDGSNLLESKYGQSGTGVGQPCGYTREQFLQFAADPRMVTLPFVCAELEEDIWQLLQTALTEIIEEELGKAGQTGKEKSDVDGGMGQGGGGAGGGAGSSTVKTFGGGKKAKVGVFTVPGVQDTSAMARKVNTYENVYPSVLNPVS